MTGNVRPDSAMALVFDEKLCCLAAGDTPSPLLVSGDLRGLALESVFSKDVDAQWVSKLAGNCRETLEHGDSRGDDTEVAINGVGVLPIRVTCTPMAFANEKKRTVAVVLSDRSDFVAAQRDAEKIARTRLDFLARVGREMREPVSAVTTISAALLNAPHLDDGRRRQVDDIRTAATWLLAVVNDIVDIAGLETNHFNLTPTAFDLPLFLDNIRFLAQHLASRKNLDFQAEFTGHIPDVAVCDDGRLRQALVNLIGNAVKFTESGGIGFHVAASPGLLHFDISDTGSGIPPDEEARLLEPFRSADCRGAAPAGLGLYITRSIVELMGGELAITSDRDRGSTFSFSVPIGVAEPGDTPCRASRARTGGEPRVLVVDDNDVNLTVAAGMLKARYGIRADQASSGETALEMADKTHYDLILMDHMMPGMDGVETAMRIRGLGGQKSGIPIVALTANATSDAKEMLLAAGMDDFLAKPLRKSDLDNLLRKWIPEGCRRLSGSDAPPIRRDGSGAVRGEFPETKDDLMCELAALQRELAEYDFDAISTRLAPLMKLDLGPALSPLLAILKEKVDASDYDGARHFLSFHFPELR